MTNEERAKDVIGKLESNLKDEHDAPHTCPCCKNRLRQGIEIRAGGKHWYVVYCGHGPCNSQVSNNGGIGTTAEEAYNDLVKKMEAEDVGE